MLRLFLSLYLVIALAFATFFLGLQFLLGRYANRLLMHDAERMIAGPRYLLERELLVHPVADWPYFLLMVAVTSLAAPLVMLILVENRRQRWKGSSLGVEARFDVPMSNGKSSMRTWAPSRSPAMSSAISRANSSRCVNGRRSFSSRISSRQPSQSME